MYLLFSSLSVELPCKDTYYYFYNGFFTISNTVVLKEKRAENYQSLAPNEKSQGEHRNKQTRKKESRKDTFPLARRVQTKYGSERKTHPARLF